MARKVHRSKSRKHRRTQRKRATHRRRTQRKRGGTYYQLNGAPMAYHLSGDWSSRMSLGQGEDYFKYHKGQHGGEAPVGVIGKTFLESPQLVASAHQDGIMKAYADIAGLKDQAGGRRRRKTGKKGSSHRRAAHRRSTHRRRRTVKRRRGGGYASVSSPSMLLSSPQQYAQAGLNPHWKDVEYMDAKIRDSQ